MTRTPATSDPDKAPDACLRRRRYAQRTPRRRRHRRRRDSVGHQELPDHTHLLPGDARLDRRVRRPGPDRSRGHRVLRCRPDPTSRQSRRHDPGGRPADRSDRRRKGKDDDLDAINAAQANRALHLAVISRIRPDPRTQTYVAKKTAEGHSKMEIIRCLKRYLAREVYFILNPGRQHIVPNTRHHRTAA